MVERNIPPDWLVEINHHLVPVTHFFLGAADAPSLDRASAFVAGPLEDGSWVSDEVTNYKFRKAH